MTLSLLIRIVSSLIFEQGDTFLYLQDTNEYHNRNFVTPKKTVAQENMIELYNFSIMPQLLSSRKVHKSFLGIWASVGHMSRVRA